MQQSYGPHESIEKTLIRFLQDYCYMQYNLRLARRLYFGFPNLSKSFKTISLPIAHFDVLHKYILHIHPYDKTERRPTYYR